MSDDRFDALEVGDEDSFTHTITAADVEAFVSLTGDDNPLHVDNAYAAKTTLGKRVVHGMLTASFISTMIGTRLPGRGALWYEQHTRFLSPVSVDEEIRVWARVKHKSPAQQILVLEIGVFGNDERKVIEGEAKVKMVRPKHERTNVGRKTTMTGEQKGAVIVSGAGRGIGAAIARELAAAGHPVIVNYRDSADAADRVVGKIVESGGAATAYHADVSDRVAVRAMVDEVVDRYGSLCGIVNNASAPTPAKRFEALTWDDFQRHIDVQIKGAFNLVQAALPHLLAADGGVVVNISSVYADGVPPPKIAPYVAVKSALNAFTKSLAVEFGPKGLRVNCVSPGMTDTDFIADVPERAKMVAQAQAPLRRLAAPEDVAGAVAFLFDDNARHITGQNIRVGGGIVMG